MAGNSTKQVFQTNSSSRWSRFIWSSRLIVLLGVLAVITIIITLTRVYMPSLPNMIGVQEKEALLDSSSWLFNKSKIGKQYGGFRKFINEKVAYKAGAYPIGRRFKKKMALLYRLIPVFILSKNFLQVYAPDSM